MNKFTALTPNRFSLRAILLLLVSLMLTNGVDAQSKNDSLASQELYNKISSLDSALFETFNTCNIDKFKTFFTDDLEFYHDKDGLTISLTSEVESFKNLCRSEYKVRRELAAGSLEVYPINNYGAVEIGVHRFYETGKGRKEKLVGIAKFVHIWQKKDGEWKISRVISYDHNPVK